MEIILLFYYCKYSVHATYKTKSTVNVSKNTKKATHLWLNLWLVKVQEERMCMNNIWGLWED